MAQMQCAKCGAQKTFTNNVQFFEIAGQTYCSACADELTSGTAGETIAPATEASAHSALVAPKKRKSRTIAIVLLLLVVVVLVILYTQTGFYTVQPIGAVPEGATLFVWRTSGEPFFNSPDGHCLRAVGYVSLLCRGMAMEYAPTDRIILRLPYWEWAYLQSTGGRKFDR